jgi:type III secretory pathway component EscU
MVNKAKKIVSLALVSLMFAPFLVLGEGNFMPEPSEQLGSGLGDQYTFSDKSIVEVVETIGSYVIGILVIVAVFYVLWAAYTFITAAGDTEKITSARNRIMYAGIGIIVALLARGIIALVLQVAQ